MFNTSQFLPGIQTAQQVLTHPLIVFPVSALPLKFVALSPDVDMYSNLWKAQCSLDDSEKNYKEHFEMSHV